MGPHCPHSAPASECYSKLDVVIHLEPDILESEVKWVLGSITTNKASGGDRIPADYLNPKR